MTGNDININNWPQDISVLIPAFKSAEQLSAFLPSLLSIVPNNRVCIVDDASHDATESVCSKYQVEYLLQDINQGKGAALKRGFNHLLKKQARWILTMDADGQHAVDDIPGFIKASKEYPDTGIIIGYRDIKLKSMPSARIFSNTVTSFILSIICKRKIQDSQCGYRLYSSKFLEKIQIMYKRFEMESEVIIKACFYGFSIRFIQVQTLYFNGQSHISHLKDMLRWIRAVVIVWLELNRSKLSGQKFILA